MKCVLLLDEERYQKIFLPETLAKLSEEMEVIYRPHRKMDPDNTREMISGADIAITSWDSVKMEKEILDAAPGLKLVAHAAGSVKPIVSQEFILRQIKITSAAPALGVGVADSILGAIIMMGKRLKEQIISVDSGDWVAKEGNRAIEMFQARIGIVGAGFVGRHLIKLLRNFDVASLWVYDPYLSSQEASGLGSEKKTLEEIFSTCDYICLCAPVTSETTGMINADLIRRIKDNAVFINYARSALVDEAFLVAELQTGRFCAAIDVAAVEPPPADHPLRRLPNVLFTPHIAGAINRNIYRNGQYASREVINFSQGKPLIHQVDLSKLETIA